MKALDAMMHEKMRFMHSTLSELTIRLAYLDNIEDLENFIKCAENFEYKELAKAAKARLIEFMDIVDGDTTEGKWLIPPKDVVAYNSDGSILFYGNQGDLIRLQNGAYKITYLKRGKGKGTKKEEEKILIEPIGKRKLRID